MENKSVSSMTEGNPTKLILMFTIPMLVGNLFQQLYNMVDSIIVGWGFREEAYLHSIGVEKVVFHPNDILSMME